MRIVDKEMARERPGQIENHARVSPFLEARQLWKQDRDRGSDLPDTQDHKEVRRVAQLGDLVEEIRWLSDVQASASEICPGQ